MPNYQQIKLIQIQRLKDYHHLRIEEITQRYLKLEPKEILSLFDFCI